MRVETKPFCHPREVFREVQRIAAIGAEASTQIGLYGLGLTDREEIEEAIQAGRSFCERVRSDIEILDPEGLLARLQKEPKTYKLQPLSEEEREEILEKVEFVEETLEMVEQGEVPEERLKERIKQMRQHLRELFAPYASEASAKLSEVPIPF